MLRIDITKTRLAKDGTLYKASFQGTEIVTDSKNPELDACRELLARGYRGKVQSWWPEATYPSLTLDIAKAAKLTVKDNTEGRPVFRAYKPGAEVALQNAA